VDARIARVVSAALVVVMLAGLALVGQAATDALAPTGTSATGAAIGRAGFAYLTGVRVFAAAVLWNRLEPLFHEYYGGVALQDQAYMLPTIRAVVALDPQFADAYYVAAWVLARRGDTEEACELALLGTQNNPRSGLLRVSYAQILWLYGEDLDEAVRQAELAAGSAEWKDPIEQHDSYAVIGGLYRAAGMTRESDLIMERIEELDESIGDRLPEGSHDHDGDGVPDH